MALPGQPEDGFGSDDDVEVTINAAELLQRPKPPPPEWIETVLTAVNEKRLSHWTPPLVWSELCYEYAKRQADTNMSHKRCKHGLTDTMQGKLGQCLLGPANGGPWKMNRYCAEKIVDLWYQEKEHYNFTKPGHHEKSANFEQVAWFGSTSCGFALSRDGKYVVANFYPAGPDSFNEEVKEKGRRNYFPPGHEPEREVIDLTNQEKYRLWFKSNVHKLQDGPAPWAPCADRVPEATESPKLPVIERGKTPKTADTAASGGISTGSGGGKRTPSPNERRKSTLKKGQSSKSISRSSTRKSLPTDESKALSRSSTRKSISSPDETRKSLKSPSDRKVQEIRLMSPKRSKSPPSSRKSQSRKSLAAFP